MAFSFVRGRERLHRAQEPTQHGNGPGRPVAAVTIALVFIGGRKALAVSRLRPKGGADGLIGQVGVVRRTVAPVGDILVEGELWRARRSLADDERALSEGEHVVVESVRGLTLSVRRAEEWELLP